MIIPFFIQKSLGYYSYSDQAQWQNKNELKEERNYISFKKRIKYLKEGKIP